MIGLVLFLAASGLVSAPPAPVTPAPLQPITQALPFAQLVQRELEQLTDDQLLTQAEHLRSRLFLDEVTTVIEVASDLELALRFATAVQILQSRPSVANGPAALPLRAAARSAAYLIQSTGYAYETREDVRASVEAIMPGPNAPSRAAIEAMIASIRNMRAYGNAWFQVALAAARNDPGSEAVSLVQEGSWHAHEGRPLEAAQRFTQVLAMAPVDHVALAAYESLLAANQPEADTVAAELRTRIEAASPILRGRFEGRLVYAQDERATTAYEKAAGTASRDEAIRQVFRYFRLGRPGAAELLVRDVLGRWNGDPEAWHAAAEIYLSLGRYESLRVLFLDAEAANRFDARLREVRIAARTQLKVREHLGEFHHPLADGDFEGDLTAFVAASGGAGSAADLAARAGRLFIAVAHWLGAKAGPAAESDKAFTAAEAEVDAILAARPKDPEALRLAVVGYAGLDKPLLGVARASKLVAKLPPEQGLSVSFLLARVEAGVALRERDPKLLKAALVRFAAIDKALSRKAPAGWDMAAWKLALTTARLGAMVLGGEPLASDEVTQARAVLDGLAGAFDESNDDGRMLALARGLSAATLAVVARDPSASESFRSARKAKREDELALLAGGLVQTLSGDANGASELYERAAVAAARPAILQWLAFSNYQAYRALGDGMRAKSALASALDLWGAAHLPATATLPGVRPLFVGDFNIGLVLDHGKPLRLELRASPVLTLIPEVVTSRAETEAALRALEAPAP